MRLGHTRGSRTLGGLCARGLERFHSSPTEMRRSSGLSYPPQGGSPTEWGAKPVGNSQSGPAAVDALAGRVSVTVGMIRMPDIIPATIHRRRRRDRIDAEQAIDAANDAANSSANHCADRTGRLRPHISAVRDAVGNALCVCGERTNKGCGDYRRKH
jgi:hypothetical protein